MSMEFFPPKTEKGEKNFFENTLPALFKLKPDYCSVTYGAGGSTKQKTIEIVDRIQREHQLPVLTHLTCVGSTREQIHQVLQQARSVGIQNILALRGDPPPGTEFNKPEGGFEFASELVTCIREFGGLGIGVAGFPEGHPACHEGKHADWDNLKLKIDAGADFVITQLFFDTDDFFAFRDHLVKRGVSVPLIPGIISILSAAQIRRLSVLCGASLPPALLAELDKRTNDDAAAVEFGIEYASRQCEALLKGGVEGFHFYTMNKAHSTTGILHNLGLV